MPLFTGSKFGFGKDAAGAGPSDPFTATGGNTHTPGDGYKYHVFTHPFPGGESDTPYPDPVGFVLTGSKACDVIVVSGGGGGGSGYYGGGGGAGTVVVGSNVTLIGGTYAVEVGGRGDKGLYPPGPSHGTDGGKSVFGDIDIVGGGFGGNGPGGTTPGSTTGGNAGGASGYTPGGTSTPYTVPTPYQGYGSWTVNINPRPTTSGDHGGDGAGGATPTPGGKPGGPGVAVPQFPGPVIPDLNTVAPSEMGPTNNYYGGGGGGHGYSTPFAGGYGGGGIAKPGDANPGYHMLGGGGGGSGNGRGNGGTGGSGIVMVRYSV